MERITFDTDEWRFKEMAGAILEVRDLSKLENGCELLTREKDQSTKWHKKFYENNARFIRLYKHFVQKVIRPLFSERIAYQKKPTFRVQLKNNVAVGEFHRDRDYGHSVHTINFWLPLIDTNELNTIWVESGVWKEDYRPQVLKYGEILKFDGANLRHGNMINTSPDTRVSIDFRIIPMSLYTESNNASINTNMQFKLGDYYGVL